MRVTIIANDNVVLVDGIGAKVDTSALKAMGVHAVQWIDTWGDVEYQAIPDPQAPTGVSKQPNQKIDDFSPYQQYLDAWETQRAQDELARKRHQAMLERQHKEHNEKARAQFLEDIRTAVREVLDERGFTNGH